MLSVSFSSLNQQFETLDFLPSGEDYSRVRSFLLLLLDPSLSPEAAETVIGSATWIKIRHGKYVVFFCFSKPVDNKRIHKSHIY